MWVLGLNGLNQAPRKMLANFFYPKKSQSLKCQNLKKSFDHPRHLKSGLPLRAPPHPFTFLNS